MLSIHSESLNWPGLLGRPDYQSSERSLSPPSSLHQATSYAMSNHGSDDGQWPYQQPYGEGYYPTAGYPAVSSATTSSYHTQPLYPTAQGYQWNPQMGSWGAPERFDDSQYAQQPQYHAPYGQPSYTSHQAYPQQQYQPQAPAYQYPVAAASPAGSTSTEDQAMAGGPKAKSGKVYRCDIPGCSSSTLFTRHADLLRHKSSVHDRSKLFPCDQPGCNRVGDKSFTRKDHLVEHQRSYHGLDIAKRQHGYQYP